MKTLLVLAPPKREIDGKRWRCCSSSPYLVAREENATEDSQVGGLIFEEEGFSWLNNLLS